MIEKLKKNKTNIFCFGLIVFLAFLAHRALFKANLFLLGQDNVSPITPFFRLKSWAYTWDGNSMLGGDYPTRMMLLFPEIIIFAVLEKLGLSLLLTQKIVYFQIFLVSGLGMYFLGLTLFRKNYLASLIAAIVYMFNHTMLGFWGVFIVQSIYIFTLYPLLLAIFIRGLRSDKPLRAAIVFGLSTLFCSAASPPLYVIIFFTIFVFFLYYFLTLPDKKRLLKFAFLTVGFYLLLILWWFLPSFDSFGSIVTSVQSVSDVQNTLYSSTQRASFLNNFALRGSNYNGYGFWGDKINNYVGYLYGTNPFLIVSGFVYPLLTFSALFFRKNRKKIVYFLAIFSLGSIFLAKGVHEPFGGVYHQLYRFIPGFSMFRTPPDKFLMATALGYSLLIGLTASSVYLGFLKYSRFLAKFTFSLLIITLLLVQWPFFTGDMIHSGKSAFPSMAIKIPDYYWRAADWLKEQQEAFRIFNFPGTIYPSRWIIYRWGYLGSYEIVSDVLQKSVIDQPPFPDFGKIRWATYVLLGNCRSLPRDLFKGGIYDLPLSQKVSRLLGLMNVKYLFFNHDVDSAHMHFGTEDQIVLSKNLETQENLKLTASFGNLDFYEVESESFLPRFYILKNTVYSGGDIKSLVDFISLDNNEIRTGIYVQPEFNRDSLTPEIGRLENERVSERADEIFIRGELKNAIGEKELMPIGETINLPYIRWSPENFIYPLVLKKEDYDKWKVRKDPEKLFEKHLFYANKRIAEIIKFQINEINGLTNLLENYKKEMEEAIKETKETREIKEIEKLKVYLEAHRKKIDQFDIDEGFKERMRTVFDDLEGKIAELETKQDFSRLVYKVEIPKTGNYSVFIKNINGLTDYLLANNEQKNEDWVSFGESYFEEGERELVLPFSGVSENLIDENLKIKDYQSDSIYRISFDYKAPKGGEVFVAEGKGGEIARADLLSTGDKFRHFERFFRSSSEVADASVHLSISVAEGKNLRVERIYQSEIMLRSSDHQPPTANHQPPKITFVKINPTKYRIKVEGAREPYTLVFSESFHKGWKAYVDLTQNASASWRSKTQNEYGNIVASYFDGEIKEGAQRNIFLDRSTFETWGKKPLPEERHLLINGYANSWYITPEDSAKREDYEVIIEFQPQRLFYIGLGISLLTLAGCLGYLGIAKINELKN